MEHANGRAIRNEKGGIIMKNAQLIKYLKMGEDIEKKGIQFYSKAMKNVSDPNSKNLLKFLISEEKNHLEYLMSFERKAKGQKNGTKIKKMNHPIFSNEAYKRIKGDRANTLNVFNTALDMEAKSARLYSSIARKVKEKKIKDFMKKLAQWEISHYKLIKTHQDAIYKWQYWEMRTQERIEM
ncbi:MAG: ferritin family protein [Nanoarchaeota archaeon]|nr:ferritin family protein [Nanoarchaeota archaeon]